MTGPRDKYDDGELDELVQDFELDMDAPIGATFAAALRDAESELPVIDDFDPDEFAPPPPPVARAPLRSRCKRLRRCSRTIIMSMMRTARARSRSR